MKNVEIYTVNYCPYCHKAVDLLDRNNIPYKQYDITDNEDEMRKKLGEMFNIEGRVTVPQIVVDGKLLGGYDKLKEELK